MHRQRQPQLLMLLQRQQLPLLVVASSQVAAAAAGAAHVAAAGARRTVRGAGALLLDACGQRSWHRESRWATLLLKELRAVVELAFHSTEQRHPATAGRTYATVLVI